MLICWNDIKIHLGFEDSYFVPPPNFSKKNKPRERKWKIVWFVTVLHVNMN